jgi:hypothetical protein
MFSNVTNTISTVVQSANSMITGKKTTPETTTPVTPTPTTSTTPTPATPTPTTSTTSTPTPPSLSIDEIPEKEQSKPLTLSEPESSDVDAILKKDKEPQTEISQLRESNKKAEDELKKLKLEMKNLVPIVKQSGGHTLKNKNKNKKKNNKTKSKSKRKISKRKMRKFNNLV